MSYDKEFNRLIGRRRLSEWKLESAVDSFEMLLAKHLTADVKMNQKSGYVPAASVLAQREFHRQYDELEKLGRTARGDYWQEWSGKNKVQCGFRDNRDKVLYKAGLDRLAELLYGAGYKLAARPSGSSIAMNDSLAKTVQARHGEWLRAMEKAGATIREEKLSEGADEGFAEEFAKHRQVTGRPMSLADWNATMKLALERNLEPEETDYTYNKFDLGKVTSTFSPFSNLTYTPAREFAPALYVSGPTETLAALAKVAEKKLGAFEAEMVSKNRLRIAWD